MLLQEEYFRRHRLAVPIIPHVRQASVILQADRGYVMMTLRRVDIIARPHRYEINFYQPVHNGYTCDLYWGPAGRGWEIEYEDYAPWLVRWAGECRHRPLVDPAEVRLALWEMFLVMADGRLAFLAKEIAFSVDPAVPVPDRLALADECAGRLPEDLLAIYREEVRSKIPYHAPWLAQLVAKHYDQDPSSSHLAVRQGRADGV